MRSYQFVGSIIRDQSVVWSAATITPFCVVRALCIVNVTMEYIDYLEYHVPPPPRMRLPRYHDYNPFNDLTDEEFKDRFRFSKEAVNELIEVLTPRLGVPDNRAYHSIPNWKKVLVALRFFADGTFHRETGDLLNVCESASCQIVHKVALAICLELNLLRLSAAF